MYFVKLTTTDGEPCYINLSRVNQIVEINGKTHILYSCEDYEVVIESPDEILVEAS